MPRRYRAPLPAAPSELGHSVHSGWIATALGGMFTVARASRDAACISTTNGDAGIRHSGEKEFCPSRIGEHRVGTSALAVACRDWLNFILTALLHYAALRERYLSDRQGGGASPSLAIAMRAIGWGSIQEPSAEEVADYLVELVDDCVAGHHDVDQLVGAVARLLRDCGPLLDGGLPPAAAYEAAAQEMLEHYVRGDAQQGD